VKASQPEPELRHPVLPRRVSIQTGSVDELARVKGLGLKIAKEIVKARPFSSVADLIRVRGLGEKTIARLADLVTL
jgi:competence protein ComEA